jgi:hypothetical protein
MNWKRFSILLIVIIAICVAASLVYYVPQTFEYTRFCHRIAKADRVVATEAPNGPSITITGDKVGDIIRAMKPAHQVPRDIGPQLSIIMRFYSGTNNLGDVWIWSGWFFANGHAYHARGGALGTLVSKPVMRAIGYPDDWNVPD